MIPLPHDPIERLQRLLEVLRSPEGCPWDREQTHQSLKAQLLEECYETLEAIESGRSQDLKEELGDLLLHIAFHAQLAREENLFGLQEIAEEACQKLLRRHPHVFGDAGAMSSAEEVAQRWNELKKAEKKERRSELDGVPKPLPALQRAQKLIKRAAGAGLGKPSPSSLAEEIARKAQELSRVPKENHRQKEALLGELLWKISALATLLNLDAEGSLRSTLQTFEKRFRSKEEELRKGGRAWKDLPFEEAYRMWFEPERGEVS
jgi:tetrapyrrole methylase family protein/MazG family protein